MNPFLVMVDFEKAAINALESTFLSVVSGCFFHLSRNIYRKIQSAGFTNQYIENAGFALLIKMLPSLAFVPESQVIHYFNLLMEEFPPFPILLWNLYTRVNLKVARTNNSVEGWHNGFQSGISCTSQFHKITTIFTAGTISTRSDVDKVGIWGGQDSILAKYCQEQGYNNDCN